MKINWAVRIRHKPFWIAMISAIMLIANQIASIFGVDITIVSTQIQQTLETVLVILSLLGIVIDPTTQGIKDSKNALTYKKPKCDDDD